MADLPLVARLCGPSMNDDLDSVDPAIRQALDGQVRLLSFAEACAVVTEGGVISGILSVTHPPVGAEQLDALGPVRVVSNYGVGVDHIDTAECASRGIPVGHTPGVLTDSTADLAWTLLMACARRVVPADAYARGPEYVHYQNMIFLGKDVAGTTLGVIGMGRIGGEVARRAQGFRMRVLYHNRSESAEAAGLGAQRAESLEQLLRESDYVVIACPCTDETRGMINASTLALMKPTASLINVARGPIVVTEALQAAIEAGRLHSAGLDVTDPEPLPRDHPLLLSDRVVFAPHRGSATAETRRAMTELCVENLKRGLRGESLAAQFQ